MKINKSTNRRKYILIAIIALVLVILAGAVAYYYVSTKDNETGQTNNSDNRSTTVTSDEGQTPDNQKSSIPSKNNTDDPDAQEPVASGSSVRLVSYDQRDGNLTLVSQISSTITNGTCTFSFSSDGAKPIVRSSVVKESKCTIVVPEVEFEKLGVWKVHTNYNQSDKKIAESDDAITIT